MMSDHEMLLFEEANAKARAAVIGARQAEILLNVEFQQANFGESGSPDLTQMEILHLARMFAEQPEEWGDFQELVGLIQAVNSQPSA